MENKKQKSKSKREKAKSRKQKLIQQGGGQTINKSIPPLRIQKSQSTIPAQPKFSSNNRVDSSSMGG